jgi:hypothetical protein
MMTPVTLGAHELTARVSPAGRAIADGKRRLETWWISSDTSASVYLITKGISIALITVRDDTATGLNETVTAGTTLAYQ